jgi:hypothetical protein
MYLKKKKSKVGRVSISCMSYPCSPPKKGKKGGAKGKKKKAIRQ